MNAAKTANSLFIGIGFILAIYVFSTIDRVMWLERRDNELLVEELPATKLSPAELEAHLSVVADGVRNAGWGPELYGPYLDGHCHMYWAHGSKQSCDADGTVSARMISLDLSTVGMVRQDEISASYTEVILGRHSFAEYVAKRHRRSRVYYDPEVGPDTLLAHRTRIAGAFGTHNFEFATRCDMPEIARKHGVRYMFRRPYEGAQTQPEVEAALEALVGHCRAHLLAPQDTAGF